MIPDNHVLLAKLCSFYPGSAAEIDQLHERVCVKSSTESQWEVWSSPLVFRVGWQTDRVHALLATAVRPPLVRRVSGSCRSGPVSRRFVFSGEVPLAELGTGSCPPHRDRSRQRYWRTLCVGWRPSRTPSTQTEMCVVEKCSITQEGR